MSEFRRPRALRAIRLMARREVMVLLRERGGFAALFLLVTVAWLPPVLSPQQTGELGIAGFVDALPFTLALAGVILPLLGLLAGAGLLAGEVEDGSLRVVLTLPISRTACFVGKVLGRSVVFAAAYLVAFGSISIVIAATAGTDGAGDYLTLVGFGLLLSLVCGGIGAAIAASGKGRMHAYGWALGMWLVLAIALDAVLLTLVIAMAPPPPEQVGRGGHGEIAAPHPMPTLGSREGMEHRPMKMPIKDTRAKHDPHARHAEPEATPNEQPSGWLLLLNPVDLYRLTTLAASSGLRRRLELPLPSRDPVTLWGGIAGAWVVWLLAPAFLAAARFRRLTLS